MPPGPSGNSIRKSAPNIATELSLHNPPWPQIMSLGTRTTQQGMRALPVYSNFHFRQSSFPVGGWTSPGLYSPLRQKFFSWPSLCSLV